MRYTMRHITHRYCTAIVAMFFVVLLGAQSWNTATTFATVDNITTPINTNDNTATISLPGETYPFILQPVQPLTIGSAKVRTPHTTPAGLQHRHIRLFYSHYQILLVGRAIQRTLFHSDCHHLYVLCRMII